MSLYQFTKGHEFLDRIGVPRLDSYEDNVVIEHYDFAEQEAKGDMEWREDGVYLKIDGVFRRGFLYNKNYLVDQYGMPKFHVTQCTTLLRFVENGTLHRFYFWSNAPKVLVAQRRGTERYPDKVLQVCRNCADSIIEESITRQSTTASEFKHVEVEIKPTTETDIFGRPLNWSAISKNYRQRKNYTCESCGTGGDDLRIASDRRFIDADHIIAHELTNTSDKNLQCLCVLCHYFKDDVHEAKLDKSHIRVRVNNFVDAYADVLSAKNLSRLKKYRSKFPAG
jgi:5-methylcytosine-specific restriction endonuclease McrA